VDKQNFCCGAVVCSPESCSPERHSKPWKVLALLSFHKRVLGRCRHQFNLSKRRMQVHVGFSLHQLVIGALVGRACGLLRQLFVIIWFQASSGLITSLYPESTRHGSEDVTLRTNRSTCVPRGVVLNFYLGKVLNWTQERNTCCSSVKRQSLAIESSRSSQCWAWDGFLIGPCKWTAVRFNVQSFFLLITFLFSGFNFLFVL
jgi:hypothetical protein